MASNGKNSQSEKGPSSDERLLEAAWPKALSLITEGFVHDVNNCLTGILSTSESCLQPSSATPGKEELTLIQECAQKANRLLRMLMQVHDEKPQRGLHDLNQIAGETFEILTHVFERRIGLESRIASEPLPIQGDAAELKRALILLALSAADAIPGTGKIKLGTSLVSEIPVGKNAPKSIRLPCAGASITAETGATVDPGREEEGRARFAVAEGAMAKARGIVWVASSPLTGISYRLLLPRKKI